VHGLLGKLFLAARESLAVTATRGADTLGQMRGEFRRKVWAHKTWPKLIATAQTWKGAKKERAAGFCGTGAQSIALPGTPATSPSNALRSACLRGKLGTTGPFIWNLIMSRGEQNRTSFVVSKTGINSSAGEDSSPLQPVFEEVRA
jgi:hypothetical protein